MTTVRTLGSTANRPAARIDVIQWNGVAPVPAEFTALSSNLTTLFGTIFVQVLDDAGIPVPNAIVEVTFTKATNDIVEDASAAGTTDGHGVVTGFGTGGGANVTAGYFSGCAAVNNPAGGLAAQSFITHVIVANAYGQVALKVATQPTPADFPTGLRIRSGSAQVSVAVAI